MGLETPGNLGQDSLNGYCPSAHVQLPDIIRQAADGTFIKRCIAQETCPHSIVGSPWTLKNPVTRPKCHLSNE